MASAGGANVSAGEEVKETTFGGDVPNAETLEAIEEVRRMKADPSLGKAYTDIRQMFDELLSDV